MNQRKIAAERLTPKQLDAYRLYEARILGHHSMTHRDMATGLGITPSAFTSRLTAAKHRLNHSNKGDAA